MKIKETRGRKKKYNFHLKKEQQMKVPFSNSARQLAYKAALSGGYKIKTWVEFDNLIIVRHNGKNSGF
jgi:hypothetical protein